MLSKSYQLFVVSNITCLWGSNLLHVLAYRYPDEEVGQLPMAFVVRQNGSNNLTEDQIMEFVAKKVHTLAAYKYPLITYCINCWLAYDIFLHVLIELSFIRLPLTRRYAKLFSLIQYHGCHLASCWGASCINKSHFLKVLAGCNAHEATSSNGWGQLAVWAVKINASWATDEIHVLLSWKTGAEICRITMVFYLYIVFYMLMLKSFNCDWSRLELSII